MISDLIRYLFFQSQYYVCQALTFLSGHSPEYYSSQNGAQGLFMEMLCLVCTILIVTWILQIIFIAIPYYRIFKRVGMNPLHTLWILMPFIGCFVVALVLSFGRWKRESV